MRGPCRILPVCLLLLVCARGASGQTPEPPAAPPPEPEQVEAERELADWLARRRAAGRRASSASCSALSSWLHRSTLVSPAASRFEGEDRQLAIRLDSTEPRIRVRVAADGVELKIRFLVHPRRRRGLMDQVHRRILEAVQAAPGVEFAYRTVRSVPAPSAAAAVVADRNDLQSYGSAEL